MAVVIEALVKRGYSIAWRVLDAQYFGVPQRRRRIFIVGCLGNKWRTPEEILALSESRAGYLTQSKQKRENSSNRIRKRIEASRTWWNGGDIAETITRTSAEQRMPDKNRFQAILDLQ